MTFNYLLMVQYQIRKICLLAVITFLCTFYINFFTLVISLTMLVVKELILGS